MGAHPVVFDGPETPERSRTGLVLEDCPLRISALEVNHDPVAPAYAYRVDYEGRSVVVTGDTKYHPPLVTGAQGADVLVSDAIARPMVEVLAKVWPAPAMIALRLLCTTSRITTFLPPRRRRLQRRR